MPLFLGGPRFVVVQFHESVVTDHLSVMKLVLERLKRGEFQWFIDEPYSDHYTYHFEVDIPATVEEEDAIKTAAIDYISGQIEDVQYDLERRKAESSLHTAMEGNVVGRIKDEMYEAASLQGEPSEVALTCQNMTDADVLSSSSSEHEMQKNEEKGENLDRLDMESVHSSLSSQSDFEEFRKRKENVEYFEKESLITSFGSQSDLDLRRKAKTV